MNRKAAMDKSLTALGLAAAAGLVMMAAPSQALAQLQDLSGDGINDANFNQLPDTVTLTGVARDFRERNESNGHPDFERRPSAGFGHYMGNVAMQLDEQGKPVFQGGGNKISSQWKDANHNPIHPSLYDPSKGDIAGNYGTSDPGGISSAESFRQWFRDVPGVNVSLPVEITLVREQGSDVYIFDDRHDETFSDLGGFFPINGKGFGNSSGENKNFHFTYELATEFVYNEGSGQQFTFNGDDDVWVFIDDRLVIDIGGVHSRVTQTVDLDRLDWLEDGGKYSLKFFFAERHRTQSNFRIETTLNLRNAELPTTAAMYD